MRRRDFIKVVTVSGSGLMLASFVPSPLFAQGKENDEPGIFSPSVFLKIDSEGAVTVVVQRSEMGQGVRTALPMLVAEELKVEWESIRVEQAEGDKKYGDQTTGGSMSIRVSYDPFRKAGATARIMLITAAANRWNVKPEDCIAEKGFVINKKNNEKLSYGELVNDAAKLPVPEDVELTDPEDFEIIGKPIPRVDTPPKVYGSAIFGIDIVKPGMVYAAVERPPAFGGKVQSYNDSQTRSIKGVNDVFEISTGVAVTADSTWKSFKGKDELEIDWNLGPNKDKDTEDIRNSLKEHLNKEGEIIASVGNPDMELPEGSKLIEALYEFPFITHAPMDPMNCVAVVKDGKAELWTPTQNPQTARSAVAQALGMDEKDVTIYVTLMGGAFGRRLQVDYAIEAAEIAKKTGKPVKLTWTREDDMKHSFYRPPSLNKLTGAVDKSGNPILFTHYVIAPSIIHNRYNYKAEPKDADIADGTQVHYNFPNYKVNGTIVPTFVPISWLRSVYNTQNPFAAEAFIDELAFAAGKDPFEFRRDLLPENSRLRGVLETAAEKSNWYEKPGKGKGKGIACFSGYGSYCAMVAEVTVDDRNNVKVDKYTCAVDCGVVVNPDIVKAQMEGGIIFALSAALKQEITIKNGGVEQSNYHDYTMLSYEESPEIDVHLMENTLPVGGIGEVAVGPTGPALVNAIFAATGKRVRKMPVNQNLQG